MGRRYWTDNARGHDGQPCFFGASSPEYCECLRASSNICSAPPYPVQRGLTQAMRDAAVKDNDIDRLQAWAGQSASLAKATSVGEVVRQPVGRCPRVAEIERTGILSRDWEVTRRRRDDPAKATCYARLTVRIGGTVISSDNLRLPEAAGLILGAKRYENARNA
jgi:hypothetical protein